MSQVASNTLPDMKKDKSTANDFLVVKNLVKYYGQVLAVNEVSFSVSRGEMLTLLGPSGCGKSTTLRCVAGLEDIDGGEIIISNEVVSSKEKGIAITPERRQIGMVFQSYAVWPHMTVWSNVAYPLQALKKPKDEIAERVQKALEMVDLADLAQRNVTKISGGQQQRVVLARAMVGNPRVLLLDEPLSNLDARLRESMRFEIRRLQQAVGITALYVTHDQSEAMVISDRVIVMNKGVIEQIGKPLEIYQHPTTRFIAAFFGETNFIEGNVLEFTGSPETVPVEVEVEGKKYTVFAQGFQGVASGDKVTVCVRPQDIEPLTGTELSGANILTGKVSNVVHMGSHVEYAFDIGSITISCHSSRDLGLKLNTRVGIRLKPESTICVPAKKNIAK